MAQAVVDGDEQRGCAGFHGLKASSAKWRGKHGLKCRLKRPGYGVAGDFLPKSGGILRRVMTMKEGIVQTRTQAKNWM